MLLKPQDTLIALAYWSLGRNGAKSNIRDIADSIGVSAGEVSKGGKRLLQARLLVERDGTLHAETGALYEWLGFGIRYAYPQEIISYGRGMATSWNCPILKSEMIPPSPGVVWAVPGGKQEGAIISPIHASVTKVASVDSGLYQVLALVEAIRGGKPRELAIARDLLKRMLKDQT